MKKKPLPGKTLKAMLKARARDRAFRFLLADGAIRGVIVNGTLLTQEMRANHELGILETMVLGRAYLGTALMAASLKGNDRISLKIDCSGPIKGLQAEANAYGEVRGFLKNPAIAIDTPLESFDLAPFFGAGIVSVTRHLENAKQPFTGQTILKYGNIALDLANYYLESEQTPTAFNLSIQFDAQGNIVGAGGLLLQAMPEASADLTAQMEKSILALPSIGKCLSEGMTPRALISDYFSDHTPRFLADHRIEFMCRCNVQRLENLICLLPIDELKDMADNGPFPLEVHCHNCNTPYAFSRSDLQKLYGLRFADN
jgi:molecular chaperone Hsp33